MTPSQSQTWSFSRDAMSLTVQTLTAIPAALQLATFSSLSEAKEGCQAWKPLSRQ